MKKNLFWGIICISIVCSQNLQLDGDIKRKLSQSGISLDQAKTILDNQNITLPSNEMLDGNQDLPSSNKVQSNEKIKQEVNKLINQDQSISIGQSDIDENIESEELELLEDEDQNIDNKTILSNTNNRNLLSYFGYNLFSKDPDLFEKSNITSIDSDYLIGPGDEIIIMLWGETELYSSYTVTRDGYIFVPNLGQVFVNS